MGCYLKRIMNMSFPANEKSQCLVCDGNFHRDNNLVPVWWPGIKQFMHDCFCLCLCVSHSICPSIQWQQLLISSLFFCTGKKCMKLNVKYKIFNLSCILLLFSLIACKSGWAQKICFPSSIFLLPPRFSLLYPVWWRWHRALRAFLHRRFWFKRWRSLGSLHVWCRPSSSPLCLLNSKTQQPQTDVGSLWGSSFPPERNPFHEE